MDMVAQCRKDISKAKQKLISYAKRYGIHENFGQKEVRKISDGYWFDMYNYKEIRDMIFQFSDWCSNYTGRE